MFAGPTKFRLGEIVATRAAIRLCGERHIDIFELLLRHARGDWGVLPREDARANDLAVLEGGRILSSYPFPPDKVWIITEADRSYTTLLLPEDY
jgi:hypothetical protein